jgi:hypothetical protein
MATAYKLTGVNRGISFGYAQYGQSNSTPAGLTYYAPGVLAVGNGSYQDYSGGIILTTLSFADGSSTQSAFGAAAMMAIIFGN